MIRRPPRSTRTDTLFPYTTLFRSAERPTVHPRHLGRGSRLIDENQPLRVEMGLGLEPSFTFRGYVFAVLLGRVRRLFLRVTLCRSKHRCPALIVGRYPTPEGGVVNTSRCKRSVLPSTHPRTTPSDLKGVGGGQR